MTRVAGSRAFNGDNLTVFALYFWFNRAYRSHPMPHQLESFKLAEQSGAEYRSWSKAIAGLGTFAVFATFWVVLGLMYHYGAESHLRFPGRRAVLERVVGLRCQHRRGFDLRSLASHQGSKAGSD